QALDVAALALGVDRVEREAALAAPGQPGDDDQPVAQERDGDVLQVVFAGAADDELILGHVPAKSIRRAPNRTGVLGRSGASAPRESVAADQPLAALVRHLNVAGEGLWLRDLRVHHSPRLIQPAE